MTNNEMVLKTIPKRLNYFIYLLVSICIIVNCAINNGSGGNESEAKIFGYVALPDSTTSSGIQAFLVNTNDTTINFSEAKFSTTNSDGYYAFDSVAQGNYVIHFKYQTNEVTYSGFTQVVVDEKSKQDIAVPKTYLSFNGVLRGIISSYPSDQSLSVSVFVCYHDFYIAKAEVRNDGTFQIPDLPPNLYTIVFRPNSTAYASFSRPDVQINSRDTTSIVVNGLITSSLLREQLPYVNDSILVKKILDTNGVQSNVSTICKISEEFRIIELNLEGRKISQIPSCIRGLTSLRVLNLRNNKVSLLPDEIATCSLLSVLNVDNNLLILLPESIGELKNLVTLRVRDNRITQLPSSIGLLTKCSELSIAHNLLTKLPATISTMELLEILAVQNNRLDSLPSEVARFKYLTTLNVQNNRLVNLPQNISQILTLKKLTIANNFIVSLPQDIGLLENLELLWAGGNLIDSVPYSIGSCKNLRILSFSDNRLHTLPKSIGNLSNLQELYLDSNKIFDLPDSITQLPSLRFLQIACNKLCKIPSTLSLWIERYATDWQTSQQCDTDTDSIITVLSPMYSEKYMQGDRLHITWKCQAASEFDNFVMDISISFDNETTWYKITERGGPISINSPQWGNFFWRIPPYIITDANEKISTISKKCYIKVSDYNDPSYQDVTDGPFEINGPPLSLTKPIGGESFIVGDYLPIVWNTYSSNIIAIACSLSVDNGMSWIAIHERKCVLNKDSDWKNVNIMLPDSLYSQKENRKISLISSTCRIKISDFIGCSSNYCFSAISSGTFTIKEK